MGRDAYDKHIKGENLEAMNYDKEIIERYNKGCE